MGLLFQNHQGQALASHGFHSGLRRRCQQGPDYFHRRAVSLRHPDDEPLGYWSDTQ